MISFRPILSANGFSRRSLLTVSLLGVVICVLAGAAYAILPYKSDWSDTYQPAVLRLLLGQPLYEGPSNSFLNAPWALIPLIPIAVFPPQLSRAMLFVVNLGSYIIVAIKLNAKPIGLAAFLLSYPVIYGLIYGQVDGLVSLGIILPPPLGLFFILAKPQIGLALAVFWLVEAWHTGGVKRVLVTFLPVTVVSVIAYCLYGNWFLRAGFPIGQTWNTSLWPQSLPIGVALLVVALQQRKREPALMASPFLSPYLAAHSWAVTLLGLISNTVLISVTSASVWLVWLLGGGAMNR